VRIPITPFHGYNSGSKHSRSNRNSNFKNCILIIDLGVDSLVDVGVDRRVDLGEYLDQKIFFVEF
jgi:hypothetical protein